MSFLIASRTPTRTFSARARTAFEALQFMEEARGLGYPLVACRDRFGRAYLRDDLVNLAAQQAAEVAGQGVGVGSSD